MLPLTAAARADRLVVDWGDAATERGRTTYALQKGGSLAITDEVRDADGGWRRFGQTLVTRVPATN